MAKSAEGTKRKKPPTFQHLPLNRAKKLKKSWVEVQKIKSQWKAQKRKEGLITKQPVIEGVHDHDSENDNGESDENNIEDKDAETDISGSDMDDGDEGKSRVKDSSEDYDEETPVPARPNPMTQINASTRSHETKRNQPGKHRETKTEDGDEQPSLRELNRQAYSRSSLHSYKSDPLYRHSSGGGSGRGGRGQSRGRGRGRGQPDMRLRMNAMLEKIKRDFA